ncbi:MAG TPA: protein kinase [Planctomycetota bacterium]|nr:protein kinase [Planctomycetota bacterium]
MLPPEGDATGAAHRALDLVKRQPLAGDSRYETGVLLGCGGAARVFRARDVKLQRDVALKVLDTARELSPESGMRFRREAEVLARLSHPNIVTIHDVLERPPAIVMELVDGQPLAAVLSEKRHELRALLGLLEKVARAVHYAHERGIVHRDLKPGNILVDRSFEPKVADFGIARLLADESHLTRTGTFLGTPAYMAPEQAMGDLKRIDARTDVYALGAILHEILLGAPPFFGTTVDELLIKKVDREVEVPEPLDPSVPRDVLSIALRALARDPARRHPSADAFADAIGRILRSPAAPPKRSRSLALAIVALAGAGALALVATRSEAPRERDAPRPALETPRPPARPAPKGRIPSPSPGRIVSEQDGRDAAAARGRCLEALARKDFERAANEAERGLALDPSDDESWCCLSIVRKAQGDIAGAFEVLDAAIAYIESRGQELLKPSTGHGNDVEVLTAQLRNTKVLGQLYVARANVAYTDRTLRDYERAMELTPDDYWNVRAQYADAILRNERDPRRALEVLENMERTPNPRWRVHIVRANAMLALDDPAGAVDQATRAVEIAGTDEGRLAALRTRAKALLARGDRDGAARDLEDVVRLAPTDADRRALEDARR